VYPELAYDTNDTREKNSETSIYNTDGYLVEGEMLPIEDVINGMLDWVRVLDLNGNIIYINKAMEEALKRPVVGKRCYEAFGRAEPCKDCVSHKCAFDGKTHEKEEVFDDRYFSVMSSPIKNKHGDVVAIVEVLRDVTKVKLLQKQIMEQNRKHRDDIEMAKKIQLSLLPVKLPKDKAEFSYIYTPCETLGGDFLDIFMIDDDHFGLYIADVAGHGITSSLLTVFLKSTFNKETLSPSLALMELYREYNKMGFDTDLYITVFYSIIDLKNNTITYSNAGHNICPILFSSTRFEILRNAGLPICDWSEKPDYIDKSELLFKKDRVFFCTDGIIEVRNNLNEQFGEERLLYNLAACKFCPDVVLKSIIEQACKFAGVDEISTIGDDITMALLEIV